MTGEEIGQRLMEIAEIANFVAQEAALEQLKQISGRTLGALRRELTRVRREEGRPDPVGDEAALRPDATHAVLGEALLARMGRPVWDEGAFWTPDATGLWRTESLEAAETRAAEAYGGGFYTRAVKAGDYAGIARVAVGLARADGFFAAAPHGLVLGAGFLRVAGREIVEEPLDAGHRQRWALPIEPREGPPERLLAHLGRHAGLEGQADRLQEAFGATLFGMVNHYKRAVLLKGERDTGKSMLLHALERLLPPGSVVAVPPDKLDDGHYAIRLAGALCNIAGDLDPHKLISDATLKQVTGGDAISGKEVYKPATSFISRAAQWFSANDLLAARDRSEAFYGRWLPVIFTDSLADEEQDPGFLDALIEREAPEIVGWAIAGARRLVARGHFVPIPSDEALLREWRCLNDSVMSFLLDRDNRFDVTGEPAHRVTGPHLYARYRVSCMDNGSMAMGRNRFYAELKRPMWVKRGVWLQHGARVNTEVIGIRERDPGELKSEGGLSLSSLSLVGREP